eukprot:Hpha_TRINITY_DN13371_c0_g1::TRINITY_DN13371_c0_g1_i1::g.95160::m.95160
MVCDNCGSSLSPHWRLLCLTLRHDHPLFGFLLYSGKKADGTDDNFGRCERAVALLAEFWVDAFTTYLFITIALFPNTVSDWIQLTAAVSMVSGVLKMFFVQPGVAVLKRSPEKRNRTSDKDGAKIRVCSKVALWLLLLEALFICIFLMVLLRFDITDAPSRALDAGSRVKDCAADSGCKVNLFPVLAGVPQLHGQPYTGRAAGVNRTVAASGCPAQPNATEWLWNDTIEADPSTTVCAAFWDTRAHSSEALKRVSDLTSNLLTKIAQFSSHAAACRISADMADMKPLYEITSDDPGIACSFCMEEDPSSSSLQRSNVTCALQRIVDTAGQFCLCEAVEPTFIMIFIGGCLSQYMGWLILEPPKGWLLARYCPCCCAQYSDEDENCFSWFPVNPCYSVAYRAPQFNKQEPGSELTEPLRTMNMTYTPPAGTPPPMMLEPQRV